MSDVFGLLFSRNQVERALLDLLQNPPVGPNDQVGTAPRIVYYLAEVERQTGLTPHTLPTPPGPDSYRGGLDFNTLRAEWFPLLTVLAQPLGDAGALDTTSYGQGYQIQVAATVGDDSEDTARLIADSYGIAVTGAILQHGSLGIGATTTILTRMPSTKLLSPANRQVARSVSVFATQIKPVITNAGPIDWPSDPYAAAGNWPEVETVDVTVDADPLTT